MPHVEQRLLVHGLVLERGVKRLRSLHRGTIVAKTRFLQRRNDGGIRAVAKWSTRRGRPGGIGAAAWNSSIGAVRVDASFEEFLEPRIDSRAAETPAQKRDDAECGQVALVEHDGLRSAIGRELVRGRIDEVEDRAGTCAVAQIPVND